MAFASLIPGLLAIAALVAMAEPSTRTIRGRVVLAEDGRPAVGVRVMALDGQGEYGGVIHGEGTTDADGAFTIAKLPPERARLWAFSQPEAYADRFTELTAVEGSVDAADVIVRMHRGSTISGTVEYVGDVGSTHCLPLTADVSPAPSCPPLHHMSPMADSRTGGSAFRIRAIPYGQATIDVMNVCRLHYPASVVRVERDGKPLEGPIDCTTARSIDGIRVIVEVRRR